MSIQVSSIPEAPTVSSRASDRTTYLAELVAQRPALTGNSALQAVRDRAATLLAEQSIPSTRDEEWRFTDLAPLLQVKFEAAQLTAVNQAAIAPFLLPEATYRLVFVNGIYAAELSSVPAAAGLEISDLSSAKPEFLSEYLGHQSGEAEVFTTLNTASFTDGAVIHVAKSTALAAPVHLLWLTTAEQPAIAHPRCVVVAEPGSQITLVEEFVSLGESVYWNNPVTEIWLKQCAQVNHTRVQRESTAAFHTGKTAVSQDWESHYTCHAISLGGKISRHNLEIFETGEQTDTTLNGLTMIRGGQLSDTHSTIAYTRPYGRSRQLHKTIVDDQARAVFNGKVSVPKAAQLTDAGQLNRNLLLSPKARVDAKPQLEIVADNVKCSHGATVSQLDAEELFYLQSRCLDSDMAQKLLIYGFAVEIINQIPVESLRQTLTRSVQTSPL